MSNSPTNTSNKQISAEHQLTELQTAFKDLEQERDQLQAQKQRLEGELRFATGLVALLLCIGIWSYLFKNDMPSLVDAPSNTSEVNHTSPIGEQGPKIPAQPHTPPHHQPSHQLPSKTLQKYQSGPNNTHSLQPTVPALSTPKYPHKQRSSKRYPHKQRSSKRYPHKQRSSKRYPHKQQPIGLERKGQIKASRLKRFGDPIPAHLVPAGWCPTGFIYGAYRMCLKRNAQNRCVQRSHQVQYGCIKRPRKNRNK
jgi:hypothetical protein